MKLVKRGDWNFPVVFGRAKDVVDIRLEVRPHLLAMYRRLEQLGGISLAAQQVGIPLRFFVWRDYQNGTKFFSVVINPRVDYSTSERIKVREADLCDPSRVLEVSRPIAIKVTYLNAAGDETRELPLSGLHAQVFLHEVERQYGLSRFADPPPVKESIREGAAT